MTDDARDAATLGTGEGAAFGHRPPRPGFRLMLAPTAESAHNTLGERLTLRACFRIEDVRFAFDSSFVGPQIAGEMPLLADLLDKHTLTRGTTRSRPPLAVFGHADPVGNDDYNKKLTGRRAAAVYAMLIRDVDIWEDLYTNPAGGDEWGVRSVQAMLAALGHDPGPVDGSAGEQTRAAVQAFQGDQGLAVDGKAGPQTRKKLYRAYMDLLCGPRLELKKEDFLGQGKDAKGKADYQGCGEFNPALMFSRAENEAYERDPDKTARNADNAPNRRVMIMLFPPGRKVDPALWPCPRASEGPAACRQRFFADSDERRRFQERRREFAETADTFACRFYYMITDDSPCEGNDSLFLECFIYLKLFDDTFQRVLVDQPYTIRSEGGVSLSGRTDADGVLRHESLPDDHYTLACGDREETVEVYYMSEKDEQSGKPWHMRVRGFTNGNATV